MLTMRMIGPNAYRIREDDQPIGRIRFASERVPGVWLWHVTVNVPGPQSTGSATTLDDAKVNFRKAWERFKEEHGPERLARRPMPRRTSGRRPSRTDRYWPVSIPGGPKLILRWPSLS